MAAVQGTQDTLISLHSFTHIPWFLMIPLFAVGINVTFRLPFSVYTHRIAQRISNTELIHWAWIWRIHSDIAREGVPKAQAEKEAKQRYKIMASRVRRNLGLQRWKIFLPYLSTPIWIMGIDVVRRICGSKGGTLMSLITGSEEHAEAAPGTPGATQTASSPADLPSAAADQVSAVDPSVAAAVAEHVKSLPDPSITIEGCLWFSDLSAPDPYYIIPIALSAMLITNQLPTSRAEMRLFLGLDTTKGPTTPIRFRRAFTVVAISIGALAADLPAAIGLYWLSSSVAHFLIQRALSYFMPIKKSTVKRCEGAESPVLRPNPAEMVASRTD